MQSAIVERAIQRAKTGDMRTGACGPCAPACPPPGQARNAQEMASYYNRGLPGQGENCKYTLLPVAAQALTAVAGETVITVTAQVVICVESLVAVSQGGATGLGFTFRNLTIANRPQLIVDRVYHSALFAPDARCACQLPGDCTTVGSTVRISITALEDQRVYFYLRGPAKM